VNDANLHRPSPEHRSTPVPVLSLAKWGLGWGVSAWVLPALFQHGGGTVTVVRDGVTHKSVPNPPMRSWMSTETQVVVVIVALSVSLWALWRVYRSHGQVRGKAYALAGAILAGAKLIWLTS